MATATKDSKSPKSELEKVDTNKRVCVLGLVLSTHIGKREKEKNMKLLSCRCCPHCYRDEGESSPRCHCTDEKKPCEEQAEDGNKQEFDAVAKVWGYYECRVEANSEEEAFAQASKEIENEDFGYLRDIEWEVLRTTCVKPTKKTPTIDEEAKKAILEAYWSNHETLVDMTAVLENGGCLDTGLCDGDCIDATYEAGYGAALEFVMEKLGIEL